MANFRPKPWINAFGKISIFRLFQLLVFIGYNSVFFTLEYHKTNFPSLDCLKKKHEKIGKFGAKPWTNPFGKMSIYRHFQLLVFIG